MKVLATLIAMLTVAPTVESFALRQSEPVPNDIIPCIQAKCPNEYNTCKATAGCEDKLNKCLAKCGEKVNQICWSLCLGGPGPAANVALCAVNQGCISKGTMVEELVREVIEFIE